MKEIITKVYNFHELSAAAKVKARDWFREGDDFTAEAVIDNAKAIAALMGINIDEIHYSGFGSQSDGASFTGTWNAAYIQHGKAKEYAPNDAEIERIASVFEVIGKRHKESSFLVTHLASYNHSLWDLASGGNEFCADFGVEEMVSDARLINAAETQLKQTARDFMKWIFEQIEKEYEYHSADEQVDESILSMEYTFTEDGVRFG